MDKKERNYLFVIVGLGCAFAVALGLCIQLSGRNRRSDSRITELEQRLIDSQQKLTTQVERYAVLESKYADLERGLRECSERTDAILDRDAKTLGEVRQKIQNLKDILVDLHSLSVRGGGSARDINREALNDQCTNKSF